MSAPAHTPSSAEEPIAVHARVAAALERVLPYLGPAIALVLGAAALARRSLDVDEAATVAAVQGSFSDVVERALSDDPARVGYLALLQPIAAWDDAEYWIRLPSVVAAVVAAVACYRLGRRLVGRSAGAAASVALASSLGVVSISRSVGPLALALAAMLVSSALFARAVERGNAIWWAVYALSAAFLPLTHPVAASALAAQVIAIAVGRREINLRLAVPAVTVAAVESAIFLVAAVVDRADAPDGAGTLELADIGVGAARAAGWSPVLVGLAAYGVVALYRRTAGETHWREALVVGLAVMPLVAVLVAGVALPVYPRSGLVVAAAGLAVVAGVGLVSIGDRALRLATTASLLAVAAAALVTAGTRAEQEDWRTAARFARATTPPPRGSVVVLPERARSALAYYAPKIRTSLVGRGDAVTVIVAGDPATAAATARNVVSPPRYALLEQRSAGTRLVVQRWVRPD